MAATIENLAVAPATRLLTAADLLMFPTDLPSGPVDYELDNGRLVIMMVTRGIHGIVQNRFGAALNVQGEQLRHGVAFVESGVVLWRNPDRVVGPDVGFVCRASLPIRYTAEGYIESIPDLIVEVRSKNDTKPRLERKIADYLKAGVRLAIVVDPDTRSASLHRANQPVVALAETDELTCEDIIPGFRLPLANLFADLPPAAPAG